MIRKPRVSEVPAIKLLIDEAAQEGAMLPRTVSELYENIRDFNVYVDEVGVGGCCALHVDMEDLAEIRSLVVRKDLHGRHIGARLLEACLADALNLGITRVYALTRVPVFFEKNRFREINKQELPNKVFRDCVRCSQFPNCDEIAMIRELGGDPASPS